MCNQSIKEILRRRLEKASPLCTIWPRTRFLDTPIATAWRYANSRDGTNLMSSTLEKRRWRSFEQVGIESHKFGAALRARGLVAAPDQTTLDKIKTPCTIAIFENTCPEWMISAIGAFSQGMIVTTVYATLGMNAVIEAINDGSISAVVCNKSNVKSLVDKLDKMKSLKTIIYTNDCVAPDDKTELPKTPRGVVISSFEDFVASGDTAAFPPTPPKSGTCAVIMYTSGSTGKVSLVKIVVHYCRLPFRLLTLIVPLFLFSPREL